MTVYEMPIPPEPDDLTVVQDATGHVWQRLDADAATAKNAAENPSKRWFCVSPRIPGFMSARKGPRSWHGLLVNDGPLVRMVPEIDAATPVDDQLVESVARRVRQLEHEEARR